MRYGIISDLHANIEALTVAVAEIDKMGVDKIVCMGDLIGYNASPREVLDLVIGRKIECISGNHDRYLSGATALDQSVRKDTSEVIEWTKTQVTPEQSAFVAGLPKFRMEGTEFLMVHGSPRHEDEYILTADILRGSLNHLMTKWPGTSVCFYGHTHVPICASDERVENQLPENTTLKLGRFSTYLINVGSVGQPRDGHPETAFGLFDSTKREIIFRRLPYDVKSAQAKVLAAGLSERMAKRLENGR